MRSLNIRHRAATRRRQPRLDWLRKMMAAVRQLWTFARRRLFGRFRRQAVASLIGVAALAVDSVTLGAMLVG